MQTHTNEACMYVYVGCSCQGGLPHSTAGEKGVGWALIRLSRVPGTGVVIIQDFVLLLLLSIFSGGGEGQKSVQNSTKRKARAKPHGKERARFNRWTHVHSMHGCIRSLSGPNSYTYPPAKKHALPTHNILHDTYTRNPGTQKNRTHSSNIGRSNSYVSL